MTAERRYSPPKSGERLCKLSGDREMSAALSAVRRAGKQKIVLKGGMPDQFENEACKGSIKMNRRILHGREPFYAC